MTPHIAHCAKVSERTVGHIFIRDVVLPGSSHRLRQLHAGWCRALQRRRRPRQHAAGLLLQDAGAAEGGESSFPIRAFPPRSCPMHCRRAAPLSLSPHLSPPLPPHSFPMRSREACTEGYQASCLLAASPSPASRDRLPFSPAPLSCPMCSSMEGPRASCRRQRRQQQRQPMQIPSGCRGPPVPHTW